MKQSWGQRYLRQPCGKAPRRESLCMFELGVVGSWHRYGEETYPLCHVESFQCVSKAGNIQTEVIHCDINETSGLDSSQSELSVFELPEPFGFREESIGQAVGVPKPCAVCE
jgi:hypothetical protein